MPPPFLAFFPRVASRVAVVALALALGACGGGDADVTSVLISGKVTYDFVPAEAQRADSGPGWTGGLAYVRTQARPARGVQVVAVADDGQEIAATRVDASGAYTLKVPARTSVRLRAKARLLQASASGPSWDFSVRDNTSPGYAEGKAALYTVQGEAFDSGSRDAVRDLHAASGWTGSAYGAPRAAAPFAILDQFYSAIEKVLAADPGVVFPPMNTYWSVDNRPADGEISIGEIGTSHWQSSSDAQGLYILGAADVDTDEYDTGVVVHEWGHYFESRLGRSDSIGGPHGPRNVLDMRLAFGEAWGNALAGMVRDDPIYIDTQEPGQATIGLRMDLDELPAAEPKGWFNEASVQHLLYQIHKAPELGFDDIYRVMTGSQKATEAYTSLFSFATYLRRDAAPAGRAVLDDLLAGIHVVHGDALDIWGSHQDYPPSLPDAAAGRGLVLPIYTTLTPSAAPVTVCTAALIPGEWGNRLANGRHFRLPIAQPGVYKLRVSSAIEIGGADFSYHGEAIETEEIDDETLRLHFNNSGDRVVTLTTKAPGGCLTVRLFQ